MDKLIDNNVWKYIRRKKFFVFSDVMIVTKVTQEYLVQLLAQYESKGFIKFQSGKKITDRQYLVVKKLDAVTGNIKVNKDGKKSLKPLLSVLALINDFEAEKIAYSSLFGKSNLLAGVFKESLKKLEKIEVIEKIQEDTYMPRNYKGSYRVNTNILQAINELVTKKEFSKIQLMIDEAKPKEKTPKVTKTAVKKVSRTVVADRYKETAEYKRRLTKIQEEDKKLGRKELLKKVKVSKGTISLLLNGKYPNPQKMINTVFSRLGLEDEIIGVVAPSNSLKDLAKEVEKL